jgi:hypothetical protein
MGYFCIERAALGYEGSLYKGRRRSIFTGSSTVLGRVWESFLPRERSNSEDATGNDTEREAVERVKQVSRSKQYGLTSAMTYSMAASGCDGQKTQRHEPLGAAVETAVRA